MDKKRLIVGFFFAVGVVAVCVFGNTVIEVAAILILALIAQYEILGALRSGGYHPMAWPGYLFAAMLVPALWFGGAEALWALFIVVIGAGVTVRVFSRKVTTDDLLCSFLPLLYPLPLFSVMIQAAWIGEPAGRTILLCGIAFASLTDVFAYFTGRAFGKHKLCPELSPKKTVEGAIGGFLGSMLIGGVLYGLQFVWGAAYPWWAYVGCAPFCSVAGQIGDLSASAIKRKMGIKDYGTIFPGHGGVLDRFDSILFAVPVVYIFFRFVLL